MPQTLHGHRLENNKKVPVFIAHKKINYFCIYSESGTPCDNFSSSFLNLFFVHNLKGISMALSSTLKMLSLLTAGLLISACASKNPEGSSVSGASDTGVIADSGSGSEITGSSLPETGIVGSGVQGGAVGIELLEEFQQQVGNQVLFATDRYDLTPEAQQIIQRQAEWLKQHPTLGILVEGHCDERGTREYNLALGERRAVAIKNYLVALGIGSNRIRTISYGKEKPFVVGTGESVWSQNRRGVLVLTK